MPKPVNKGTVTKFCGEYVQDLIEYGKRGDSKSMFCRDKGICLKTFETWCDNYPNFAMAWQLAKLYADAWFYELGKNHLVVVEQYQGDKVKFDTALYRYMTAGRLAWRGEKTMENLANAVGSLEQRMNSISKDFASGKLTAAQAAAASKLVTDTGAIKAQNAIMDQLEALEKQMEELRNRPVGVSQFSPEPEYEEKTTQQALDGRIDVGR